MEVKVLCSCGQKYVFEVEPVAGRMPVPVACPACGTDGTDAANTSIRELHPRQAMRIEAATVPPPPMPPPPPMGIAAATSSGPAPLATSAHGRHSPAPDKPEAKLAAGIAGGFGGASVGVGMMYGFAAATGFRFPLMGIGIGVLAGFGAKLANRGGNAALGLIAGALALLAVVFTLYLLHGDFPVMSIISVVVSASVAHQIAAK